MKKTTQISKERVQEKYLPKKDYGIRNITIVILCFFVGSAWCVAYYPNTFITFYQFSKFFVFLAVVGFLIPIRFYSKWLHFTVYEAYIFNIMGVAPFICGTMLLLNYHFYTNKFVHYYYIEKVETPTQSIYNIIGFDVERNFVSGKVKPIDLTYPNEHTFSTNYFYEAEIRNGIFGFKTIKKDPIILEKKQLN